MCSCDCVRVGRRYQVLDDQVVVEGEGGPTADGLWLVTMHPAGAGEVEIRGWRHRRGQPAPDWWVAVAPLTELPDELQQIAPLPRVEGIGGAGVTAGEDRSRRSRAA